jgi:hypothetical protein
MKSFQALKAVKSCELAGYEQNLSFWKINYILNVIKTEIHITQNITAYMQVIKLHRPDIKIESNQTSQFSNN